MRTVSSALESHFAQECTTLATCWKITRTDSTIMGFTDNVEDILFESVTYKASTGFTASAVASQSDMSVDNLDVEGMLDSQAITESDIAAGLYDHAGLEIFMLNYADTSQGKMIIRRGFLGEVSIRRGQFVAEVRGLSQKIQQVIGRTYQPSCDALLGDARCGVNLASFTTSTSVSSVTSSQIFTASALTQDAGYFTGGVVQWTSGNNDGLSMEVKEFLNGQVTLALPMPYAIAVSDSFDIIAACDKTRDTCKSVFNNLDNFRGFPDVPGMDKLLETSGTFTGDGDG